jgi:hypothetical protein
MTKLAFFLLICAGLMPVVLAGCSGLQTQTDYDPSVDFNRFQTWDWLPDPPKDESAEQQVDELTHRRVRTAIKNHLEAKGCSQNSENPDFLVVYHGGIKESVAMTQTRDAYKNNPYTEFDWSYAYTYQWRLGFLEIDVLDAGTKKLAWKGFVEAEVKPTADPEEKTRRITKAVDAILDKFPPGK